MAKETITRLVDDIDASEASRTVRFTWQGVSYEIDLSEKHTEELRDVFAPYVEAARRTGGRRSTGSRSRSSSSSSSSGQGVVGRSKEALKSIRDWAKSEGWAVSDRGRLPNNVVEAYDAAHK